jgi:hypothetical protein
MKRGADPEFSSAEAALRFYFRAREFLGVTANGVFQIARDSPGWLPAGEGILENYIAIAASLRGLDDFQFWLMHELYGPTCFRARQRTLGNALRTAQARFPRRVITRREIGRVRRSAVEILRRDLAVNGLVPAPGGAPAILVIASGEQADERDEHAPMRQ